MFKKNHRHLQIPLTRHVDERPGKLRKRLENSWAGVFYRDFLCRIDETPFAELSADCPARPVEQIQTAIRGHSPNPDKLHLADFTIRLNEDGKPVKIALNARI